MIKEGTPFSRPAEVPPAVPRVTEPALNSLKQASAALGRGDPLGAIGELAHLGESDGDPHALAIRGIALAQLGEFERAKKR